MKKRLCSQAWLVAAGLFLVPAWTGAIEVLDRDYEVEQYATFDGALWQMTFDDAGNLYLVERLSGEITKVTPEREVGVLTTITPPTGGDLLGLTWTGDSAFGAFLYALRRYSGGSGSDVISIDPVDGSWSVLASFNDCGTYLGLDRVGEYGGDLYSGTGCRDRLFRVTPSGDVSVFSSWPFGRNGGGPRGIDFDPSGRYGGRMYVASAYSPSAADVSGLFEITRDGSALRFADTIVSARVVLFAPSGTKFEEEMFIYGKREFSLPDSVWRIAPDGSAEEFVTDINNPIASNPYPMAFGSDGALYVSRYFPSSDTTTVYRVFIPQSPQTRAIIRLNDAIEEKTIAIEAIDKALASERDALDLLETVPKGQSLRARNQLRSAMIRGRVSRKHLIASRALLISTVELLERDPCHGRGCSRLRPLDRENMRGHGKNDSHTSYPPRSRRRSPHDP